MSDPTFDEVLEHLRNFGELSVADDLEKKFRPEPITLELTQEEAQVLLFILNRIGGYPEGPRGKANQVLTKLEAAEVQRKDFYTEHDRRNIYFA